MTMTMLFFDFGPYRVIMPLREAYEFYLSFKGSSR